MLRTPLIVVRPRFLGRHRYGRTGANPILKHLGPFKNTAIRKHILLRLGDIQLVHRQNALHPSRVQLRFQENVTQPPQRHAGSF